MKVPSTEVQNNFGKYIKIASELEDVIITKKGREAAKLVSCEDKPLVREEAVNYLVGGNQKMSYEQFLKFTENAEARYELIDGEIFLLASPRFSHQMAVTRLLKIILNWFTGKKCVPLTAPFDITLEKSKNNICVVQPDIVVICDTERVDKKGRYLGVPSLAVEVLSDSTKSKDMVRKLDLYMRTGVKEYWMVDTEKKEAYVYCFEKIGEKFDIGDYETVKPGGRIISKAFKGLEIPVDDIFPA